MREAAVGHQCPECVADGHKSVRRPQTALGARVASGGPVVTYSLIGLCVLAYLAEIASTKVVYDFMMVGLGVADGQWYRLFTSMFLHQPPRGGSFGITHILFNMWALWVLGPALEQALGRWRFLSLYMLSGLGGSALLYLVAPNVAAVGASGAIFGLFGAVFVLGKKMGVQTGPIAMLLVLNLVITFAVPGISWQAHIGGLVVGSVLALAYGLAPKAGRLGIHVTATVTLTILLIALIVAKTITINAGV
jgi:membrane associated rhomboid family serine protease